MNGEDMKIEAIQAASVKSYYCLFGGRNISKGV